MVREIAAHRRHDSMAAFIDTTHECEQVNGRLEASREEAGAGEEEVTQGGRLKVEDVGRRPSAFEDLEIEMGEDGADEESLRCGNGSIERRCACEECLKLCGSQGRGSGETVIEECADREMGWGDEPDQPT